jgi:hypothetical protein
VRQAVEEHIGNCLVRRAFPSQRSKDLLAHMSSVGLQEFGKAIDSFGLDACRCH